MSDDFFGLELPTSAGNGDETPSGWRYLSRGGCVKCAFSTTTAVEMGVGMNRRVHKGQNFWFVEQVDRGVFEGRLLNDRHVPSGDAETIDLQELVDGYRPELAYYEELVLPAMLELEKTLDRGDEHRERGRLDRARAEYERARGIEENNVKALFGLGLIYLERGETDRARDLLAELVKIKATFDGKNQHLFNEFGIALRKNRMFAEAVEYFRRGLDFVKDDENLYYNLARAHYENGEWEASLDNLIQSHRLNPQLEVTRNLFEVMVGLENNEDLQLRYGKPAVPPHVASRARQILATGSGRLRLDEGPVAAGLEIERGRARSGSPVGFVELKKHGRGK
ncbi:tetratricopeptide repeat protein [Pseudodesulfovibrio portus]|uniref:Tetratricopeptide repeat protein n=1 Tax=Pseudodesulfovibrio portus TaxID=231439 RepID=A0ABM8AQQ8_9BACT|nr:tetratricopeptide repeat protein [Pseudodesulfovibrio portus]BDQ33756.1 hypothetical protein JCM14722_12980 [Pseudodesulfovibrio portus]